MAPCISSLGVVNNYQHYYNYYQPEHIYYFLTTTPYENLQLLTPLPFTIILVESDYVNRYGWNLSYFVCKSYCKFQVPNDRVSFLMISSNVYFSS